MKLLGLLKGISTQQRTLLVLGIGILGMLLIFASRPNEKLSAGIIEAEDYTVRDHNLYLEERLLSLVSRIDGVGRVDIMITLENSGEAVYAHEEKRVVDRQSGESGTTAEKESTELKYVMVEGGNGRRQALVETQREPKIQGVVIVCEGAEDVRVQARVINVVTTALHIPSTRVCVEKIGSN